MPRASLQNIKNMSKNANFFKFKNVQIVRKPNSGRQTRQNTQIDTQGTAEEQFANIAAAAQAEAIVDIDDSLTDHDDSVDYSTQPPQTIETALQVETQIPRTTQVPNSSSTDGSTDSSPDTSSIEVIQPTQILEIHLPQNPPQCVPPNTPQSPRTNVVVETNEGLFTEDEDEDNQVVPPPLGDWTTEQGRTKTLSPTPQNKQLVQSAIELTAQDLEPSEQSITNKCVEVDLQLSTHPDWSQPNHWLRQDICNLIPLLFQLWFNTEGFPNLEKYLYETVGSLPYQSLLRIALDSVFEEYPEISVVQTKVYRMLKCHLSIINHTSVMQFDNISLSNHDFDRVAGTDFYMVSGLDNRPDLSTQTDLNETFYSIYSKVQRQAYRVTEQSLHRLRRDKSNSCPDWYNCKLIQTNSLFQIGDILRLTNQVILSILISNRPTNPNRYTPANTSKRIRGPV